MSERKGQRFYVPELKAKVKTLEAMFGDKRMRSELNPRTVDKWLKDPEPTPYLTSLKKYFGVIGMKESDMIKSKRAFARSAADLYAKMPTSGRLHYREDDVVAIYESFSTAGGPAESVLGHTLKMIQIETVKNDFRYLRGYYHMYHYWKSADPDDTGKIRRNLVHVYDMDNKCGLMNCRIMISPMKGLAQRDWWIYEGWVVNIRSKLFCLFECMQGMAPEIVSLNIYKPSFWPAPDRFVLQGILVALSLKGVPCASNLALVKIDSNDEYKHHIGYFSPEQIKSEGRQIDIETFIDNRMHAAYDVMSPLAIDNR